jgi:hypothetical protein
VPALLPLFFVITYAGWLWFFGHNLHPWGAFTVKPFMPTVFGEGKVAQFSTYSYPYWGYALLLLMFVCADAGAADPPQAAARRHGGVSIMRRLLALLTMAVAATALGDGEEPARKVDAAAHGGVRADVDRPKPTFMLHERDKRIHGLKPFQALVDAAPAGSTLKPPPGTYAGPVRLDKPLVIDGGGQVTIDAGGKGTVFLLQPAAPCCAD